MLSDIPPALLKEIETLPPGIAMPGIEAAMQAWYPKEMMRFPDQGMEHPEPSSSARGPSSSDKGAVLCLPCPTCKE